MQVFTATFHSSLSAWVILVPMIFRAGMAVPMSTVLDVLAGLEPLLVGLRAEASPPPLLSHHGTVSGKTRKWLKISHFPRFPAL